MFKYFLPGTPHDGRKVSKHTTHSNYSAVLARTEPSCIQQKKLAKWIKMNHIHLWSFLYIRIIYQNHIHLCFKSHEFSTCTAPASPPPSLGRSCRHLPWHDVYGTAFGSSPSDPCRDPQRSDEYIYYGDKWLYIYYGYIIYIYIILYVYIYI